MANSSRRAPPGLREMIAALVAAPSVSSVDPRWDCTNLTVVERLAGWLEPLGFDCRIEPLPGQPHKANLTATLTPRNGALTGGLALCGHTDTVPYDAERWCSDPLTLEERNGRLYGLGTTDMKAFLALAVEAVREFDRRRLRTPLVLLFTADEESGMDGVRALLDAHPDGVGASHAIVGEPTANRPVALHKGMMMEALHVAGRSGHSSDPRLGHNALDTMTQVLQTLLEWRTELADRYHDPRFAIPYPTLNLGQLRGGDNPNRICGEAELYIDLRPLPGMVPSALQDELDHRLRRALGSDAERLTRRTLCPAQPPLETDAEAEIVRVTEQLSGQRAHAVAFATEAPQLARLGMEVVVLGPGEIDTAHQPDESIAVAHLAPCVELLRGAIRHFCL